jgi:hypothetical protein
MEFDYKGFMQDFAIADMFGENAVRDTYKRCQEWKDNAEYWAALVLTLNHRGWMYRDKNENMCHLYAELWEKAHDHGLSHFKGEDAELYFRLTD